MSCQKLLNDLSEKVNRGLYKKEALLSSLRKQIYQFENEEHQLELIKKCQIFLQGIAEKVQNSAKLQIEQIVQATLDVCFPGQFKFDITFIPARGKTNVEISLIEDGEKINPMLATGGSLIDIISFGLRMAVLSVRMQDKDSPVDNVLLMDEPFKFLDSHRQIVIAHLLKDMCQTLGIQIVIITHRQEIEDQADKLFLVTKDMDGVSKIKEL